MAVGAPINIGLGWEAYGFLFVTGFLATAPWRFLGVILSQGLDIESEVFKWVRAVSTAIVAGLVARLLVFPAGALADVALWLRLAAFAVGLAIFFLSRKGLAAGIAGGLVALLAGQSIFG